MNNTSNNTSNLQIQLRVRKLPCTYMLSEAGEEMSSDDVNNLILVSACACLEPGGCHDNLGSSPMPISEDSEGQVNHLSVS